jgi:hypothetical protein
LRPTRTIRTGKRAISIVADIGSLAERACGEAQKRERLSFG